MDHLPLHTSQVPEPVTTINRAFALLRLIPILAMLYYRSKVLLFKFTSHEPMLILLAWLLVSFSEFVLCFLWLTGQAFMWCPVTRSVFPERLPEDRELPPIDVLICTADPKKEPVTNVMNTVLSAMSLDYPPEKLSVYLSDDAGSPLTLDACREAWSFAKSWIPFCRKFGIETINPEAYFNENEHQSQHHCSDELIVYEEKLKEKYKVFMERLKKAGESSVNSVTQDHSSSIEVINASDVDPEDDGDTKFPLLVYVAREKRLSRPHHYKAGAVNALLRVSAVISNSPYILVLDCDLYCNDPTSARQAMCLLLDPKINRTLAFVQFPQMFYNISKDDIYDGQMRLLFKTLCQGMDGNMGPNLNGCGFYLKRQALYRSPKQEETFIHQHTKEKFGTSNEFLASLRRNDNTRVLSNKVLQESRILASCDYEENTQWGETIGLLYFCILEDMLTGYYLHCQGWKSAYLYPSRPCFLGCPVSNMNDALAQARKWYSELLQLALSKYCPLTYGLSRISFLQAMCYAYMMFATLIAVIPLYAAVTQVCLLIGIPLYPRASDPWFLMFAVVLLQCTGQHLFDVLSTGGSVKLWWNEFRIGMVKSVTAIFFAFFDAIMKKMGIRKPDYWTTNKVSDDEKLEKYKEGKFVLQGSTVFLIPLVIVVILSILSLVVGVGRMVLRQVSSSDEMFGQVFLSVFVLILSYPIFEGMVTNVTKQK